MALTYPWFLLGLLAVAIPIAIHFFELRRPQRVLFTNVGFIREIKLITARQRKLKHLLILAARIGFVAFLVLLFCQPFIPAPEQRQQSGGVVTAVVDASPSMGIENEEGHALFDQAIEQADELPTVYPASARYLLPTASNSLLTGSGFHAALQQASISGQARSVTALLDRARHTADVRQTFVFSDFQKNTFDPTALQKDSVSQAYLVPLRGKAAANVYVDSVLLDDAFVRSGSDIGLRVRLRNGGTQAATDCQVKVFVGSRQVAALRTTVGAHESTTTTVKVRLEGSQLAQCRVEVEDLPVTFDNTYYFTLQASPQIGILNVTGPQETAVGRVYRNEALFALGRSSSQNLDYSRLNAANLIVLEELPTLSSALQENLVRAVNQGATLVVVPPAASPDAQAEYSRLFRSLGIGGVQWQAAAGAVPVLEDVAAPAMQNPFFQDVFSAPNQRTVMPKAAPVLRWSRSGTDVLKMRSGDGFLAGFSSGKGKVYLFAAPFGTAYSNFTQHALFVPVMYRLAMLSYRTEQRLAYRLNQGTIALSIPVQSVNRRDEPVVSLRRDSLTVIPAQRWEGSSLRLTLPAAVQEPGFYQVVYNDKVLTTLALNLNKAESELNYYSAAELRQLIGPNRPNIQVYEGGTDRSVAAHYKAQRVGTPLWRYCLLLALGCLLTEVLLLRFMGRGKPQPASAVAA